MPEETDGIIAIIKIKVQLLVLPPTFSNKSQISLRQCVRRLLSKRLCFRSSASDKKAFSKTQLHKHLNISQIPKTVECHKFQARTRKGSSPSIPCCTSRQGHTSTCETCPARKLYCETPSAVNHGLGILTVFVLSQRALSVYIPGLLRREFFRRRCVLQHILCPSFQASRCEFLHFHRASSSSRSLHDQRYSATTGLAPLSHLQPSRLLS